MKKLITILLVAMSAVALRAEVKSYPTETINGRLCYVYHAEKSIGLYRISVNFGCSQEDILHFNPELKKRGLQLDEKLYIPVSEEDLREMKHAHTAHAAKPEPVAEPQPIAEPQPVVEPQPVAEPVAEPVVADTVIRDTLVEETMIEELRTFDGKIRIALLMPLYAHETELNPNAEKYIDFYEGALIATYDLRGEQIPVELHVFDVEKSEAQVSELIETGKLDNMSAILGPVYPAQVNLIADFSARKHIPTLIPMADKLPQIETNPYLMQFNVSPVDEARVMAEYLAADSIVNVVLISARETDVPEAIRLLRAEIRNHNIPTTSISAHNILIDSIETALVPDKENIILLNSERYSNISTLIPKIEQAQSHYRVVLLSQYSWQRENIDLPQIYMTEFDTNEPTDLSQYEETFDRYFHHEHESINPRFDLLGYDLMRALVARLLGVEYEGLQSSFEWVRIENGGVKNQHLEIIRR